MTFDSTMKFLTNMSRAQIDAKLPELKKFAEAADLAEVAKQLSVGPGAADLEARLTRSLELLGGKDEYGLLIDQIDMLLINLRNLKT